MTRVVWSVGHSARTLEEFTQILDAHGIRAVADVRRAPHSRRHPQFNVDRLNRGLHGAGVSYDYFGDELGGRRRVQPGSRHVALQGSPLQGYADHQGSEAFARGVRRLEALASGTSTAVMCAESNYKKCHRRLLADVLAARGWEVRHAETVSRWRPHEPTPGSRVVGRGVEYRPLGLDEVNGSA